MFLKNYLFTSESVSEGHPDKVADQISDAVLDAYLAQEPEARVACETMVCPNTVVLAGELRAKDHPNLENIVRQTLRNIGYCNNLVPDFDADTVQIINKMGQQSSEIAQGVDAGDNKDEGAGDQGLMFGYATNETPVLMPAPIYYAHRVMGKMAQWRHQGESKLRPDAKCQLTVAYEGDQPVGVTTAVVSHQHAPDADIKDLAMQALNEVLPAGWLTKDTQYHINPTGSFVHGGPGADAGLTGRKIIVDTYGGMARHGGGAFSGKDPTKVDRSAAYAARYLAKNVVAAGLADFCEIQLCYAIGVSEPLAIYLDTFSTAKDVTHDQIIAAIREVMTLTPRGIRQRLNLNQPIYQRSAAYGHFGREVVENNGNTYFTWEKTDLVEALQAACGRKDCA